MYNMFKHLKSNILFRRLQVKNTYFCKNFDKIPFSLEQTRLTQRLSRFFIKKDSFLIEAKAEKWLRVRKWPSL